MSYKVDDLEWLTRGGRFNLEVQACVVGDAKSEIHILVLRQGIATQYVVDQATQCLKGCVLNGHILGEVPRPVSSYRAPAPAQASRSDEEMSDADDVPQEADDGAVMHGDRMELQFQGDLRMHTGAAGMVIRRPNRSAIVDEGDDYGRIYGYHARVDYPTNSEEWRAILDESGILNKLVDAVGDSTEEDRVLVAGDHLPDLLQDGVIFAAHWPADDAWYPSLFCRTEDDEHVFATLERDGASETTWSVDRVESDGFHAMKRSCVGSFKLQSLKKSGRKGA